MTDTPGIAKTPKATPSPKTATTTELDVTEDNKKEKPPKEIPMIRDSGFFQHETGDTYEGEFEAKKKDHSVKMQGQGVYTTAEGDTYSGHWEADKLIDQTVISYNDGAEFKGTIKEWSYTGRGQYTYPDGSILTGEFSDNCPVGNLVLTDPNGHIWLGKADHGFGWFEPVNHFYELLETTQTRVKRRHKNVLNALSKQATSSSTAVKPSLDSNKPSPASTKTNSPSNKTKSSINKK